jgi:hypothetical protein
MSFPCHYSWSSSHSVHATENRSLNNQLRNKLRRDYRLTLFNIAATSLYSCARIKESEVQLLNCCTRIVTYCVVGTTDIKKKVVSQGRLCVCLPAYLYTILTQNTGSAGKEPAIIPLQKYNHSHIHELDVHGSVHLGNV